MELATAGLFRARWTNEIHDELIRNVLKIGQTCRLDRWNGREPT
jgi:hypothetical protein